MQISFWSLGRLKLSKNKNGHAPKNLLMRILFDAFLQIIRIVTSFGRLHYLFLYSRYKLNHFSFRFLFLKKRDIQSLATWDNRYLDKTNNKILKSLIFDWRNVMLTIVIKKHLTFLKTTLCDILSLTISSNYIVRLHCYHANFCI